jgi:hypothetical protein
MRRQFGSSQTEMVNNLYVTYQLPAYEKAMETDRALNVLEK